MIRNVIIVIILLIFGGVSAQDELKQVRLFQNFFRDAPITSTPYADAGFSFSNFDAANLMSLGVQGGFQAKELLEIGGSINFLSVNPDNGDGESGISDIIIAGRYLLKPDETKISAGGFITLPVGEEKVGQSNLNFGAFGALRHPLESGMVITGTLGIDFSEVPKRGDNDSDYETSLNIGGGVIYPQSDQLSIIGEIGLRTEGDFFLLSGGVDYELTSGRVRGALGVGLDDGAPDVMLLGSYLFQF